MDDVNNSNMPIRAFLIAGLLGTLLTGSLLANTDHLAALRLQQHFAPDDGGANGDLFGSAVAIDGDWAVVGAPGDDSARFVDEGSAYILKLESGTWKIHQKLSVHGDTENYHGTTPINFGQAVAISGDWMAVGAPNYYNPNSTRGRVRLYKRDPSDTWTLQQTLAPPNTSGTRRFGAALALYGRHHLLVGAPEQEGTSLAPHVYTYRTTSPTALWTSNLQMTGPAVGGTGFGRSLAIDQNTAYVGLPGYTAPATPTSKGEVRIYTLATSGPTAPLIHTLVNPAPDEIQRFGGSLAVSGGRLLVGVRGWNIAKQVIACVFSGASPWLLESKILAPENFPQIDSDCSVAMNDGIGLVGCPRLLPGGLTEVHLNFFYTVQLPPEYVSRPASTGPLLTGATPDLPQIVATSRQQTLAGNPGYYASGLTAGGVVPMLNDRPTGPTLVPPLTHLQLNDDFGKRLAADGNTILAAAPRWQNRGTVHVYTRKDGIWDISHSLDNPVTGRYGLRIYGEVMAVSGDWMAISSPRAGAYKILVYPFRDGQWSRTPYIIDRLDDMVLHEIISLDISGGSMVVVTRASEGWRAGRYSLTASGPVYASKALAEKPEHIAQEISLSGDRATLMLTNSTGNPIPISPVYDTSKNPWKKISTLSLPKGNSPMSPDYSRGLIWAGKSILMGNGTPSPVAFMPSGASWTSSLPFQENSSTRPLSMDAEGELALLSSRSYLRLYSQRSGKWLFAKDLQLYHSYNGDYLASALTQDSLAFGKTQHLTATHLSTLSIYLSAAMEVYDGPTTSGQLIGRDYTLNLGAVALAQDTPLPLTLKNTGDSTWTFAGLEAAPQNVTLPSTFQSTPVPPGGTITLPAVLRPIVGGQQTMTLKFRIAGSSTPLATVTLSFTAQSDLPLPSESVAGLSKFVRLGEAFTLRLAASASRSLSYRWFKEGRALANDTTSILFRAKATAADAGTYSVEVTAPDGSKQLIKDILVGVYQYQEKTLRVALGGTLSAQAKAWGPGIRYGWNAGPDNASIRGSRTASLQIRNFHPGYLNYGNLQAFAYMGDTGALIGSWPLDAALLTELYPSGPIELVVGEDAGFISGVIASEAPDNLRFSAQGLPPGVILDPTMGHLTGAPTQPGIYHVTYRASFTGGAAKPATDRILVFPAGDRRLRPGTLVGVIWTGNPGPVEVTNYLEQLVPGLMQVEITTSGKATAQWQLGGRRLSAVGQFSHLGVNEHCQLLFPPALGLGPLDCRVNISSQTQEISCQVRHELPSGITLTWESMLQYRALPVTTNIRQFAGRKTTFFSSAGEDHLQPGGSGFGSMTITNALNVNVAGTLPDGTALTFSSMVLDYGAGIPFCASTKPEAFFTGNFNYDLFGGDAHWRRPPSAKDRFYPAGFKAAHYQISAAAYQPPAPGMLLFPQMEPTDGRVSLSLLSSALSSELHLPGRLTTAHKVNFNAPNLNQAKISFYTPTGFFTGSAVVDDLLPDSETRRQKRAVSFKGMLSSERGEGLFLLPKLPDATAEPPTTTANSPILSGKVIFSPAAE